MHTDRSQFVAKWVTYVVNPLVLPPILLGIVCAALDLPPNQFATIVGLSILLFALVPFGIILRVAKNNGGTSIELRQKELRFAPYLVSIAADLAVLLLVHVLAAPVPPVITILLLCYAANAIILFLINLRFKISLHMASITGLVSMAMFILVSKQAILVREPTLLGLLVACGAFLTPVLVWARLHLRAHTAKEVIAGTIFGLFVPFGLLYIFDTILQ